MSTLVSVDVQTSAPSSVLCSADGGGGSLPTAESCVNGFHVSVLRDSGATAAGVRRCLVREGQYTDKKQNITSFGGKVECFPLACVQVDTPFYFGDLVCCVIDDPAVDLIIGNLRGVDPVAGLVGKVGSRGPLKGLFILLCLRLCGKLW